MLPTATGANLFNSEQSGPRGPGLLHKPGEKKRRISPRNLLCGISAPPGFVFCSLGLPGGHRAQLRPQSNSRRETRGLFRSQFAANILPGCPCFAVGSRLPAKARVDGSHRPRFCSLRSDPRLFALRGRSRELFLCSPGRPVPSVGALGLSPSLRRLSPFLLAGCRSLIRMSGASLSASQGCGGSFVAWVLPAATGSSPGAFHFPSGGPRVYFFPAASTVRGSCDPCN
jgi:hypothetical protein